MQDDENDRREYARARTRITARNRARTGPGPRPGAAQDAGGLYALLLAAIMAFTLFQGTAALRAGMKPAHPGDTLSFSAAGLPLGAKAVSVQANITQDVLGGAGPACTLDTAMMENPGGTLTVLAAQADNLTVSWAGGATASGPDACPAGAALRLPATAYHVLQGALRPAQPLAFH